MKMYNIVSLLITIILSATLVPPFIKWLYKKLDQRKAAKAEKKENGDLRV